MGSNPAERATPLSQGRVRVLKAPVGVMGPLPITRLKPGNSGRDRAAVPWGGSQRAPAARAEEPDGREPISACRWRYPETVSTTDLSAQVQALPERPGVYLFRNARGQVIYVGKASSLRARVRSYFGAPRSLMGKTRILVGKIADIAYVTTGTEQEALHLEATLVKQHQPLFNVRLKDDKHYPYLKVDVTERWPRVYITRRVQKDGARYFGPYASAKSVRTTLDLVKKLFPWRSCTKEITGTDPRPCLEYYIHRCIAPCTSFCTPEEYGAVIDQVLLFLEGRADLVLRDLRRQMREASESLAYEHAAVLRDQIAAVERVTEAQVTATTETAEIDVFGMARDGDEAVVQMLFVRGTKMTGTDDFLLQGARDEDPAVVLGSFLEQFYASAAAVPPQVLLPHAIADAELMRAWLSAKRGGAVELRVPVRGEKRRLVEMAQTNAAESLRMRRIKWMADQGKTTAALDELAEALNLPDAPQRIECYDISNTQGTNSVASLVVFQDGQPRPREYRRFAIKTVEGADDFASMAEVLERRFRRLGAARRAALEGGAGGSGDGDGDGDGGGGGEDGAVAAAAPVAAPVTTQAADAPKPDAARPETPQTEGEETDMPAEGWEARPDLVIVDGGKGQLSAAWDVMRNLGLDEIPLAGLAKRNEELFVVDTQEPIRLDRRSQGLYLVQRVRDEAHRFAVTYHRQVRSARGMQSALDQVRGVGPKRKQALLRKFGSVKAIREASVAEIATTPGITPGLAQTVKQEL